MGKRRLGSKNYTERGQHGEETTWGEDCIERGDFTGRELVGKEYKKRGYRRKRDMN